MLKLKLKTSQRNCFVCRLQFEVDTKGKNRPVKIHLKILSPSSNVLKYRCQFSISSCMFYIDVFVSKRYFIYLNIKWPGDELHFLQSLQSTWALRKTVLISLITLHDSTLEATSSPLHKAALENVLLAQSGCQSFIIHFTVQMLFRWLF